MGNEQPHDEKERVVGRLDLEGFDGLYCPAECACDKGDIAPCSETEPDDDGWINGCSPGYKHHDPRPGHKEFGDWAMSHSREPMTDDDWDNIAY